jgi:hypothetical protein
MPEPGTRMAPTSWLMLAGGLGLLAGMATRAWRLRARAQRSSRGRPYYAEPRHDAALIGAERFPRKGDDDFIG